MLGIITGSTGGFDGRIAQSLHVTPRTEGFVTRTIDDHRDNSIFICPGFKTIGDYINHFPRQRVKGLFYVQG